MADTISSKGRGSRVPLSVLVLTQGSSATDEILRECEERTDLWTVRVASVTASVAALQALSVALVLVGPEILSHEISALVAELNHLRNKTPVLLLRKDAMEIPASWRSQRVAVLRCPLVPGLLNRAVDLALQPTRGTRDRAHMN